MATIQGPGGGVTTISGFNIHASGWSLDIAVEVVDNTGFTDNGYRVRDGTLLNATGSITGKAQGGSSTPVLSTVFGGTATPANAKGEITLKAATGNQYVFTGNITRVGMSRDVDGSMDLTYDFESSGLILQTWGA